MATPPVVTRAMVKEYLDDYPTPGEAIAALVEDCPHLDQQTQMQGRSQQPGGTLAELILHDLDSYAD